MWSTTSRSTHRSFFHVHLPGPPFATSADTVNWSVPSILPPNQYSARHFDISDCYCAITRMLSLPHFQGDYSGEVWRIEELSDEEGLQRGEELVASHLALEERWVKVAMRLMSIGEADDGFAGGKESSVPVMG